MRSGTLDVPSIVGLGEACRLRQLEMEEDERAIAKRCCEAQIASKRDKLQRLLLDKIPGLVINGDTTSRLAGNLHISIPDIPNSAVIARVRSKLAISTGSACSSGVEAPSHVLQALNLPSEVIEGALRIGLGKFTTDEEIDRAAEILSTAVSKTRQAMLT
jgi:cysteine desulfurase